MKKTAPQNVPTKQQQQRFNSVNVNISKPSSGPVRQSNSGQYGRMVLLGPSKSKTRTGLPTQTKVVAPPLPLNLPSSTKPEKEVPVVSNSSTVWGSKSESPLSTSPIPDSISTSPPAQGQTPWQPNKHSSLKQDIQPSRQDSASRYGREEEFPTLKNTGTNGNAAPRYLDEKSNYGPSRSSTHDWNSREDRERDRDFDRRRDDYREGWTSNQERRGPPDDYRRTDNYGGRYSREEDSRERYQSQPSRPFVGGNGENFYSRNPPRILSHNAERDSHRKEREPKQPTKSKPSSSLENLDITSSSGFKWGDAEVNEHMDYSQPLVFPDSKDEELEKKLKVEQQKMEEKRRKEEDRKEEERRRIEEHKRKVEEEKRRQEEIRKREEEEKLKEEERRRQEELKAREEQKKKEERRREEDRRWDSTRQRGEETRPRGEETRRPYPREDTRYGSERYERYPRSERPDRSDRTERTDRTERPDRSDRTDRSDKTERPIRSSERERPARYERSDRKPREPPTRETRDRSDKPERNESQEKPEKIERTEKHVEKDSRQISSEDSYVPRNLQAREPRERPSREQRKERGGRASPTAIMKREPREEKKVDEKQEQLPQQPEKQEPSKPVETVPQPKPEEPKAPVQPKEEKPVVEKQEKESKSEKSSERESRFKPYSGRKQQFVQKFVPKAASQPEKSATPEIKQEEPKPTPPAPKTEEQKPPVQETPVVTPAPKTEEQAPVSNQPEKSKWQPRDKTSKYSAYQRKPRSSSVKYVAVKLDTKSTETAVPSTEASKAEEAHVKSEVKESPKEVSVTEEKKEESKPQRERKPRSERKSEVSENSERPSKGERPPRRERPTRTESQDISESSEKRSRYSKRPSQVVYMPKGAEIKKSESEQSTAPPPQRRPRYELSEEEIKMRDERKAQKKREREEKRAKREEEKPAEKPKPVEDIIPPTINSNVVVINDQTGIDHSIEGATDFMEVKSKAQKKREKELKEKEEKKKLKENKGKKPEKREKPEFSEKKNDRKSEKKPEKKAEKPALPPTQVLTSQPSPQKPSPRGVTIIETPQSGPAWGANKPASVVRINLTEEAKKLNLNTTSNINNTNANNTLTSKPEQEKKPEPEVKKQQTKPLESSTVQSSETAPKPNLERSKERREKKEKPERTKRSDKSKSDSQTVKYAPKARQPAPVTPVEPKQENPVQTPLPKSEISETKFVAPEVPQEAPKQVTVSLNVAPKPVTQKRVEPPAPKPQPASQLHPSNDPVVNGSDLNNSNRVQPPISAPNMNRNPRPNYAESTIPNGAPRAVQVQPGWQPIDYFPSSSNAPIYANMFPGPAMQPLQTLDYLNGSPLFVYPFHVPGMGQYGIPTTSIYDPYMSMQPVPQARQGDISGETLPPYVMDDSMNPRNNWSPVNSEPISLADYQQAQRAKQRQQTQSSASVTNNNARMKPIARPQTVSQAPSPPPSSKPNYNSNNNNRSSEKSEESSNYRPGNNKKIVKSSSREKATIKKESKPVYVEKEKTPKVVYVKKQQLQPNS